jgi:hypothetical protein
MHYHLPKSNVIIFFLYKRKVSRSKEAKEASNEQRMSPSISLTEDRSLDNSPRADRTIVATLQ